MKKNKFIRYEVKHYLYLPVDQESNHDKHVMPYAISWTEMIQRFYGHHFQNDEMPDDKFCSGVRYKRAQESEFEKQIGEDK